MKSGRFDGSNHNYFFPRLNEGWCQNRAVFWPITLEI